MDSRIDPGNCMWFQESVTFSVGATRIETPSSSPSAAVRAASERAMKQSVSRGMCGPCCSVVPIGMSTASTPAEIRSPTSGQVIRSMKCSLRWHEFDCFYPGLQTRETRAEGGAVEGTAEVNGVNLWYRTTGEGEPVVQIHGAGFGHYNFDPATPELSKHFRIVDYDMRGYGASDRPVQDYDMEVWADDLAGLMDALEIGQAHVHGTSMGGMIAIVFAGKYPERTTSVVINCAAAKLGVTGRLIFKNWIDIARLDPDGPGSRVLGRADHVAGAVQALPPGAERRGADGPHPADPARLEPHRGVHRGVSGDVRHGPDRVAAEDHVSRARARRRRGCDDAVGPGTGRHRPAGHP